MKILKPVFPLAAAGLLVLLAAVGAKAQTSTNYQNKEHVVNSGGNPAPTLTSTNYKVTLSSIGDGLLATSMSSSSYQMSGGFDEAYPPPGEVLNLRFTSKTDFGWNPEPSVGTYNVYRGLVSGLASGYGSCIQSNLTTPSTSDGTTPAAGQCFFYLVTAKNRLGEEGTLGKNSAGTPRPNASPCP
jgi:hypothetical protein